MANLTYVHLNSGQEIDTIHQVESVKLVHIPDVSHGHYATISYNWGPILERFSLAPHRTAVLQFKYGSTQKDDLSRLSALGSRLWKECENLKVLRNESLPKRRRTYFICERFGGLILKQAFAYVHERLASWPQKLDSLCGLFLLGKPHIGSSDQRDRLAQFLTKHQHVNTVDDAMSNLVAAANLFSNIMRSMSHVFVVTAYIESSKQNRFLARLFSRKYAATIPQESVQIGLDKDQESTVKFDGDFQAFWDVGSGSDLHTVLELQFKRPLPFREVPQTSGRTCSPPQSLGYRRESSSLTPSSPGSWSFITSDVGSDRSFPQRSRNLRPPLESPKAEIWLPFYYPEDPSERSRVFQGRTDELKFMHEVLSVGNRDPSQGQNLQIVSVHGFGGVGKTALANEFARTHAEEFDVMLFVRADNVSELYRQYSKIVKDTGLLKNTEQPHNHQGRDVLKRWFKDPQVTSVGGSTLSSGLNGSRLKRASWLLIFDNVEDWNTLQHFWPARGHGSVIVTSRTPNILPRLDESVGKICSLPLKTLQHSDAVEMFKYYAGKTDDTIEKDPDSRRKGGHSRIKGSDQTEDVNEEASKMVSRLHGYPIAIIQIGSYIKELNCSIRKFAESHPAEGDLYSHYLPTTLHLQGHENCVGSTWMLDLLQRENHTLAINILRVVSFLDSNSINEKLLEPNQDLPQLPGYPSTSKDFLKGYHKLMSTSLVEKTSQNAPISVPRIVQTVTQATMTTDEQNDGLVEKCFLNALARVQFQWPYLSRINHQYKIGTQGRIDRFAYCAELQPHVATLTKSYLDLAQKGFIGPNLDLAELLCEAASYFVEQSHYAEASRFLDFAASIVETARALPDLLIEYRLKICRGRIGVAFLTRDADQYFFHAQQSWTIQNERYQECHEPTAHLANAQNQMGIALIMKGHLTEAISFLEASIKSRELLPGFRRDWLFNPLYHLGHAYFHLGELNKAAEMLETAIADRIEGLGENDTVSMKTGALYYTLGDVKMELGDVNASFALHTQAYAHLKRTVGSHNIGTLHCEYKVAVHLVRLGDVDGARSSLERILADYRILPTARRYICRAALLYSKCLERIDGEDPNEPLREAVEVFNKFSDDTERTAQSITAADASSLVWYDYL